MGEAKRDANYVPTLIGVSSSDGTTPITIYVDPTTHRMLVDLAGGSGTVTSVSVVTANGISGSVATATTTPAITLTLGNITPSGVQISGLTASELVATDASKNLVSLAVATYPSLTEITYVKGVTSAIQTQLNAKAPTTSPTFATSITGSYLTASEILITDGSKNIVSAPVATYPSLTELTYVKGVTSAIQTQLNAKQATITFGTGVQTALGVNIGSAGAPVLFDGALGTPSSGTVTNLTGTASININGTVGATTPTTGVFTTLVAGSTTSLLLGTAGSAVGNIGFRNATSGTVTLAPATGALGTVTLTLPTATDTLVGKATTDTLTNKRITKRVVTTTDDSTAVIDTDITDEYELSAMANATTFTVTGTPTDGQTLVIRLKDNGTARALTWTMSGGVIGVTLPTTTVISKWSVVGFKYFSSTTSWKAIAVAQEA